MKTLWRDFCDWLAKLTTPHVCPYCNGTKIAVEIPDINTGRSLKLPCQWCRDE